MKDWKVSAKISFFVLGITSTIWFLIRVIPKPSRATYPCMRAAAPIMSGFVVYLLAISGSVFAFRKFGKRLLSTKYIAALGFLVVAVVFAFVAGSVNNTHTKASQLVLQKSFSPNAPVGTATGLKPGRVVWVYNPDATNEDCTNDVDDYWYMDANTDQDVVNTMLADGITNYSGVSSLASAWDSLFRYFNVKHAKGNVGYSSGEKIIIKVNMTNMSAGGDTTMTNLMNVTPQLMLALLEELIDTVGVPQADITIGDPYRGFAYEYLNKCHTMYPDVHYINATLTANGREITQISTDDVFFSSNTDAAHIFSSRLPQAYLDAAYMINMPSMKTHESAGITLAAKNHQGSVIGPTQNASSQYMGPYLHYDYPENPENEVMGIYRHIVDYMAHSKLGGNTLVYIIDAIWAGNNWEGNVEKWGMPPFNEDYPSSLFISQDPVATESVGYDFLYYEYYTYPTDHASADFPLRVGVNDYILQAASSANWPAGIHYDPDHADHHAPFTSLGVYEHWNNATDKKYSRDLGTGNGIELLKVVGHQGPTPVGLTSTQISNELLLKCYPNPVSDQLHISYYLTSNSNVTIALISLNGSTVANLLNNYEDLGSHNISKSVTSLGLDKGQYICKITADSNGKVTISSVKVQVL